MPVKYKLLLSVVFAFLKATWCSDLIPLCLLSVLGGIRLSLGWAWNKRPKVCTVTLLEVVRTLLEVGFCR